MRRPRLPNGTFGVIWFATVGPSRVQARVSFRDWDGVNRQVQASGPTQGAAETALKERSAARSDFHATGTILTPDSPFSELVTYWLEDLELDNYLAKATKQLYERNMRTLVVPAFHGFTLREIGVARCDWLIKELAKKSHNRATQARNVLLLSFGLAVRHEVRLGTSARIGEALAFRRCDIDVTAAVPTMAITGTIVSLAREPPERQDHPKTATSNRTAAIPTFTASAVRNRLSRLADTTPDALLFCS